MSDNRFSIRAARPVDAQALSELAVRSKGYWGYSHEFLEACRKELAVDPARIGAKDYSCFVAHDQNALVGYYSLEIIGDDSYELDALFVDPEYIGKGAGRSLMNHALEILRGRDAERLVIQGDPNAQDFYLAAGAKLIGSRASESIPGRELPLFEIEIGCGKRTAQELPQKRS